MRQKIGIAVLLFLLGLSGSVNGTQPNDKALKIGLEIGNLAPDIIEESPKGEKLTLSDLKGKYVLIDFWASWCPPCRRENPIVVSAYNTYKDKAFKDGKGFTVFSVSLDRSKESWQKAIEADKLEWPCHVSDLGGWHSRYAQVYGVRSIPSNFLIDGNGVIVARNLKGPSLETFLKNRVK